MTSRISELLDDCEVLCQLAEEASELSTAASELSKAALKLRRSIDGTNPTPKPMDECLDEQVEELSDVLNCSDVLGFTWDDGIIGFKRERWVARLEGRDGD